MTKMRPLAACFLGLGLLLLLSGCGGSHSDAQTQGSIAPTTQPKSQPPHVPHVVPPGPLQRQLPNTWPQTGLHCTFRLFSDGSGTTTVGRCLLSAALSHNVRGEHRVVGLLKTAIGLNAQRRVVVSHPFTLNAHGTYPCEKPVARSYGVKSCP